MTGIWNEFAAELTGSFTATATAIAALRLVAAMLLGGLIGLERELQDKAAGLRTHMLIAVAACLFSLIALELIALPTAAPNEQRTDILRLIEAVTAGVAFLAAGSIIVSGGHVKGLTTGAGMWMAGAVGLACGTGHAGLAVMASGLAVLVLWLFKRLSERIG
ncbi:MgtC/SapB family protein [Frigidibacter mobilis]|uniref:Protein MgtC n=1 Tax=Frigidibacter mobilis TaxID=1335048 RepID=A0A159Z662_9RHOB|nr:MgtC/SapB family protein [Frigidibacter mobilis]AMY69960.1 MgtC/SapB transporter [Frigidibacter mobilis]